MSASHGIEVDKLFHASKLVFAGLLNGLLKSLMHTESLRVLTAARGDQLELFLSLVLIQVLFGVFVFTTNGGEIVLGQHQHYRLVSLNRTDLTDPAFGTLGTAILLIDRKTEYKNISASVLHHSVC